MPRLKFSRLFTAGSIVAIALLPLIAKNEFFLHVLILIFLYSAIAMSLRLIMTTGEVSFAHAGFMGLGAYASALAVMRLGLSFWLALPMAGIIAAAIAVPVGYPAFKTKGVYFFVITTAFGEVIRLLLNYWGSVTGGPPGLIGVPKPKPLPGLDAVMDFHFRLPYYYLFYAFLLLTALVMYRLDRSRLGKIFVAIQQADSLAESIGVNIMKYKLVAFIIACFFAGLAGSLYAHYITFLNPQVFSLQFSLFLLACVVVGGQGGVTGPITGAVVLVLVSELVRGVAQYQMLFYAVGMIVVVLFLPQGVISLPTRIRPQLAKLLQALRGLVQ